MLWELERDLSRGYKQRAIIKTRMDLAVIEVVDEADMALEAAKRSATRLYCLTKGKNLVPLVDSTEIQFLSFPEFIPKIAHCYLACELHFGFLLGSLHNYRVTVYSPRKDLTPFERLGLKVVKMARETGRIGDSALRELREKFTAIFVDSRANLATKRESVLAQIGNLANGIRLSLIGKGVGNVSDLPSAASLSQTLYDQLVREGVLSEDLGRIACRSAVNPSSLPSPPAESPIFTAKFDSLKKYLSKVLTNPAIRATKAKSCKAQLKNLLHGAMQSLRTQRIPAITAAEETQVTEDIFQQLVERGLMQISEQNVRYNEGEIEEMVRNEEGQREICGRNVDVGVERVGEERVRSITLEETAKLGADLRGQLRSALSDCHVSVASASGSKQGVAQDQLAEAIYHWLLKQTPAIAKEILTDKSQISPEVLSMDHSEAVNIDLVTTEVLDIICYQERLGLGELYDVCSKQLATHSQLMQQLEPDLHPVIADITLRVISRAGLRAEQLVKVRGVAEALESLELHRDLVLVLELKEREAS